MSFTFNFTKEQLQEIIGKNAYAEYWHNALCTILPDYGIDTEKRVAAFIAQCAHESAGFKFLQENLNYRAESLTKTWPRHFPTMEIAKQYERKPQMIANRAYACLLYTSDAADE